MDNKILERFIAACGQELIDNAADISKDAAKCTDVDIWIRIQDNEFPQLEVEKTYKVTIKNAIN